MHYFYSVSLNPFNTLEDDNSNYVSVDIALITSFFHFLRVCVSLSRH